MAELYKNAEKGTLITLEFSKSKERHHFNSLTEMEAWAHTIYIQAKDISDRITFTKDQLASQFTQPFLAHHRQLLNAVGRHTKFSEDQEGAERSEMDLGTALDDIKIRAKNFFLELTPVADSVIGTAMLQFSQEDPYSALLLGLLHSEVPEIDQTRIQVLQWKTIRKAFAAERSIESTEHIAEVFKDKALELQNRYELLNSRMREDYENRSQDIEKQHRDFISNKDQLLRNAKSSHYQGRRLLARSISKTISERQKMSAELGALKKTYETHMALEAPAKYWQQKSTSHTKGFWWSLGAFSLLVIVSLATIWLLGPEFVTEVTKGGNGFSLPAFAMITIPALFIAWLLKIFANQIASNHHLKQDSVLRQTMITTYLALMKDPGTQVGVEERTLILNAIFRPADRHNDDNGPSAGLIELVRQAKS